MEKREPLRVDMWVAKTLWKTTWKFFEKLKIEVSCDPGAHFRWLLLSPARGWLWKLEVVLIGLAADSGRLGSGDRGAGHTGFRAIEESGYMFLTQ